MTTWPQRPLIYELNTCVWLHELSRREGRQVTLGSIPQYEWDRLESLGLDALWLMGVWERSPTGTRLATENPALTAEFRRVLTDLTMEDIVGSPYCIRRYAVDPRFGGPEGLAAARRELTRLGMRLLLDFVPNHVAPDHMWVSEHPEYFIPGSQEELKSRPTEFFAEGGRIFAHGRDPYFPPWPDVAQLNAFDPGLRKAVADVVCDIGSQCDGIRCDMAMLMINRIFQQTWGLRAGPCPATEYWPDLIHTARARNPGMRFIAEAYWDLEWDLQQQGFDYCYDKRLYDRLEHDGAQSVRGHLCADLGYQHKLVRFIENHDEPRAAAAFAGGKSRVAAVAATTLPGPVLFHDGQFSGKKTKIPVFLRRGPEEPADHDLERFYQMLLQCIRNDAFRQGAWRLCECTGWPDNQSHLNLVAWCWRKDTRHSLVVVNLSDQQSQGRVRVPCDDNVDPNVWQYNDVFTGRSYERSGLEVRSTGLYVELPPWGFHVLNA